MWTLEPKERVHCDNGSDVHSEASPAARQERDTLVRHTTSTGSREEGRPPCSPPLHPVARVGQFCSDLATRAPALGKPGAGAAFGRWRSGCLPTGRKAAAFLNPPPESRVSTGRQSHQQPGSGRLSHDRTARLLPVAPAGVKPASVRDSSRDREQDAPRLQGNRQACSRLPLKRGPARSPSVSRQDRMAPPPPDAPRTDEDAGETSVVSQCHPGTP